VNDENFNREGAKARRKSLRLRAFAVKHLRSSKNTNKMKSLLFAFFTSLNNLM
jgi:hypothetical protein